MPAIHENIENTHDMEIKDFPENHENDVTTEADKKSDSANEPDDAIPEYTAQNDELAAILDEATSTKAQKASDIGADSSFSQMEPEEATLYASVIVAKVISWAGEYAENDLSLHEDIKAGFALCLTPLTMKYGAMVKKHMEDISQSADMDSRVPELMAAGGAVGLASTLYLKNRKINRLKLQKAANDGN